VTAIRKEMMDNDDSSNSDSAEKLIGAAGMVDYAGR
jgi:hypothetical protein